MTLLPRLGGAARDRAFDSYLDAVMTLGSVSLDESWYGEILADDPVRAPSWSGFLRDRVRSRATSVPARVRVDLPHLDDFVAELCSEVVTMDVGPPRLVHGDVFPGNVIVDGSGIVVGLVDFASMTLQGDPALDVVGALAFLEITPAVDRTDISRLRERARHLAPSAMRCEPTYRRFYALSYLHAIEDDPSLYRWCIESLA
jgi:aminoglycoside phosphotransferase (APT) family kinase protein